MRKQAVGSSEVIAQAEARQRKLSNMFFLSHLCWLGLAVSFPMVLAGIGIIQNIENKQISQQPLDNPAGTFHTEGGY